MFSNTAKGAKTSAFNYCIVETTRKNELNLFNYLKYLFGKLPNLDTSNKDNLAQLMPWSSAFPEECHLINKCK